MAGARLTRLQLIVLQRMRSGEKVLQALNPDDVVWAYGTSYRLYSVCSAPAFGRGRSFTVGMLALASMGGKSVCSRTPHGSFSTCYRRTTF
jgi:hypothetical protein